MQAPQNRTSALKYPKQRMEKGKYLQRAIKKSQRYLEVANRKHEHTSPKSLDTKSQGTLAA